MNPNSEIGVSLRWQSEVVNCIKTTFHYFFEPGQVLGEFQISDFHFRPQPNIKFSYPGPIIL
ncbi:hypothetical protein M2354_003377 [Leclercia adecarboxylata]|jgi:hypothetical protein|nr:hypothetical protein [Leclercia adecarboxylata]